MHKLFTAAAAALLASTIAASATPIIGTWTVTDTGSNTILTQDFASSFVLNLTVGVPFTVTDFLKIQDNSTSGTGNTVTATFTFTSPTGTGAPTAIDGWFQNGNSPATETFTGAANPTVVNFSDGSILDLQFGSTSQTCPANGPHACNTTVIAPMSFTLVQGPTTREVPEPLTLSVLGAGLAGLGVLRRRKKQAA